MTEVTTILGKQVGVQFQGTQDKTNFPNNGSQSNILMLVESVGRGRLDDITHVQHDTFKARLGYERDNLEIQAVEDALNTGVPSVMVMRCFTDKDKITASTPTQQPPINSQGGTQTNSPVAQPSTTNQQQPPSTNGNPSSSDNLSSNTGNSSTITPQTPPTVFQAISDGDVVDEFTLEQLKERGYFSYGRTVISWDENQQKFRVIVSV